MIISHKHKFIFLKTRKTASTSIEIFLSQHCDKDDIFTPIGEGEDIRKEQNIFPQNYFKHELSAKILFLMKNTSKPLHPFLKKSSYLRALKRPNQKFGEHMLGYEVRENIGEEIWNSYYKFCFERNPWDKLVSNYFWNKNAKKKVDEISFNDYLKTDVGKAFREYNYSIYTYQDEVIVDFVGKYENLKDDLLKVCNKIGIDFDGELPKAKSKYRPKEHHYSYYYNDKTRELIRNHFKKEIELHGYSFENKN